MDVQSSAASQLSDRELTITRIFDAPRTLVFKAWTDPRHLANWWGPRGFSLPSCSVDLRPGGEYRLHMRGPNDDDHYMVGIFREIVEGQRVVMAGAWADAQGTFTRPPTVLTVTFEDYQGKTRLTLHHELFESVTARDEHNGGWNSSLDCLAEYLAKL